MILAHADAFGGILLSRSGKVLLVEPKNHFGGYTWTFPKGRPKAGESPSAAALRHVLEKTGYDAEILGVVPEVFSGTTSSTAFAYMGPLGRQGTPGPATAGTRWVDLSEAERLIAETATEAGRRRDLAVLRAAAEGKKVLGWANRPATCREDWGEVQSMPEQRVSVALDRLYDLSAAKRIRKGWYPAAMEEKWFTWFEEPVLHMQRSWTGYCQYEVTFAIEGERLRAISAVVNRDPRQYLETDDEADQRRVVEMMDGLFIHAPDEPGVDHFAAAFLAAAAPNYLGSPSVVAGILGQVVGWAQGYARGELNFNLAWNEMFELAQAVAEGDEYVRMPGWHTPAALGKHLVTAFGVKDEEVFADDLSYFIVEAFMILFLKVRDMILAEPPVPGKGLGFGAIPWIEELHEWATAVFLGTNEVVAPGQTISDFEQA